MTDETPPAAPLANRLFGWALAQRRVGPTVLVLALIGALLIADEVWRGRQALDLPYENLPGFYAALGFGVVSVALLAAQVLGLLFARSSGSGDGS